MFNNYSPDFLTFLIITKSYETSKKLEIFHSNLFLRFLIFLGMI